PATTLADNGALFRVNASGPSGSATSSNALLTVVAPITVSSPIGAYNFNDCLQPPDTFLAGSAYIDCSSGVGGSGVLHLTDNANSRHGAFIMRAFNTNAPLKAVTASFAVRTPDGSGTPADGISVWWGSSETSRD